MNTSRVILSANGDALPKKYSIVPPLSVPVFKVPL